MSDAIRDAIYLRVGGSAGIPPAGTKMIFADTDAAIKTMDSTGIKNSIGSVGWDALQWTRAQALLGSQLDNYMWSDLLNPNEYDVTAGTGPFAQLAGSTGGVLENGAGTGTLYFAGHKSAAGSIVPIPNIKTSPWVVASRARIVATPSGAGVETDVCGMLGSSQYLTLQFAVNTSTTVLQLGQIGASPTRTALSSLGTLGGGIAVGTWFDALLANDVAGGQVIAQINGVTAAVSTNLTNSTTQAGRPFFDTAQNAAIDFDKIFFAYKQEP